MAIALPVAGCGGDGTEGEATSAGDRGAVRASSLTKAQFIKRADAICAAGRKRWETEFGAYLDRNSKSLGAALRDHAPKIINTIFVPAYQGQIDRTRSLGAPSGDGEEVGSILAAMQRVVDEAGEQPRKFMRGTDPFAGASRLAKAYGFKVCAEADLG